jgi:polysaccharide biosynthesis transport protein
VVAVPAEFEPEGPSLLEYLAISKRRLRPILIAFSIGVVATILIALFWPARYRSMATILIEQQELPTELVRSTVTSYADQRVQIISHRVMTTQTLLDIIRRYDLYPRQRNRESREALMARMRDDVEVKMISADVIDPRSGHPTSATIAFSVAYTNRSADQAAKVANELTTLFLNENLSTRTKLAEDAASFLEEEGDRVSKEISVLEGKLAKFKSEHVNELPELVQLNMTLLDRTSQELEQSQMRRSSLEQQQIYLEAQLAQIKPNGALFSDSGERIMSPQDRLKSLKSQLASARALYAPDHPDIARLSREIAGLETETSDTGDVNDLRRNLDDARAQLAQARDRYTPDHPDRIRLERQVSSLEKDLAAATATAGKRLHAESSDKQPDNPAYIQIQSELASTRDELEALSAHQSELESQVHDYEKKIKASPQIEKDYRELARDYENAHAKYQELRAKQAEATVAKNLESDRKGERFTLIEPPLTPQEPVSPNRVLVAVMGIILSIGLGVATAAILEALDGTVRNRRDLLTMALGVPSLAIIPLIKYQAAPALRWRLPLIVTAAAIVALSLAASLVHVFYRPLDVLWFVMLRHFGWS